MQHADFTRVLDQQIDMCRSVLTKKSEGYSTAADKLHNFKVAADIRGCSVPQAVAGMMVKHTVSIYDMCESDKSFDMDLWDEKITDHLNYLFLLKAAVLEEAYDTLPWALLPYFESGPPAPSAHATVNTDGSIHLHCTEI